MELPWQRSSLSLDAEQPSPTDTCIAGCIEGDYFDAFEPTCLSFVQASTTLEFARTIGRVALTFLPLLLFKNRFARKYIKHHERFHGGVPVCEEKKALLLRRIRKRTIMFHMLLFVPVALFWVAIVASAEQTPLTGRYVVSYSHVQLIDFFFSAGDSLFFLQRKKMRLHPNLRVQSGIKLCPKYWPLTAHPSASLQMTGDTNGYGTPCED